MMSTALWIVFWVLAVLLGSLIFSLLLAAWIHVGSGDDGQQAMPDRGSADGGSVVKNGAELPEHDEPDAG